MQLHEVLVQFLKPLAAGLSYIIPKFDPRKVHLTFMVFELYWASFCPNAASIIPGVLHTQISLTYLRRHTGQSSRLTVSLQMLLSVSLYRLFLFHKVFRNFLTPNKKKTLTLTLKIFILTAEIINQTQPL